MNLLFISACQNVKRAYVINHWLDCRWIMLLSGMTRMFVYLHILLHVIIPHCMEEYFKKRNFSGCLKITLNLTLFNKNFALKLKLLKKNNTHTHTPTHPHTHPYTHIWGEIGKLNIKSMLLYMDAVIFE